MGFQKEAWNFQKETSHLGQIKAAIWGMWMEGLQRQVPRFLEEKEWFETKELKVEATSIKMVKEQFKETAVGKKM